jgi:hypothetical protein
MADLPAVIPLKHRYTFAYLVAAALVGIVLGVLITWAFFAQRPRIAATRPEIPNLTLAGASSTAAASSGTGSLSVEDQPAGMSVVIGRAEITEGQWVVVHEDREGRLGNVLGAARFVGSAKSGAVELLRATRAGATYYAVIYADNGDGQFSLEADTPLRDASGSVKSVTFKAQ